MVFAIRRRPPLNGTNFQTFFYPTFFLQLNPTYMKRILHLRNVTFDYWNPSLIPYLGKRPTSPSPFSRLSKFSFDLFRPNVPYCDWLVCLRSGFCQRQSSETSTQQLAVLRSVCLHEFELVKIFLNFKRIFFAEQQKTMKSSWFSDSQNIDLNKYC